MNENTLTDLFESRNADVIFFDRYGNEERYGHEKLFETAARAAQLLHNMGIGRGNNVVISFSEPQKFLPVFWGTLMIGAVPVISPFEKEGHKPLERIISVDAIADETFIERCTEITVDITDIRSAETKGSDTAVIFFTSGSTSAPKGVVLTHDNLLAQLRSFSEAVSCTDEDVIVSFLPLTHAYGFSCMYLLSLFCEAEIYLTSPDTIAEAPEVYLDMLSRKKATITGGMNFTLRTLCSIYPEHKESIDLAVLRIFTLSGEVISDRQMQQFYDLFKENGLREQVLTPFLGMTEAGGAVTIPHTDQKRIVDGNGNTLLGKKLSCIKLAILDENGEVSEEGELGEIAIAGDAVFGKYLTENGVPVNTSEWFRTGDHGYYKNDRLCITGRIKDIIFVNGINYYPNDIESYLVKNKPGLQGRVFIRQIYRRAGEGDVVLFYETKDTEEKAAEQLAVIKELLLSGYGLPISAYIPLSKIPCLSNGKRDIKKLESQYIQGELDERADSIKRIWKNTNSYTGSADDNEYVLALGNIWKELLGVSPAEEPDFYLAGGDSIMMMRLVSAIEKKLGISVTLSELRENLEFGRLVSFIGSHADEKTERVSVISDKDGMYEPFPLTEVQMSYYMGRDTMYELGGVSAHGYYEYETVLPLDRLEMAVRRIIALHCAFRTHITSDGKQQISENIPEYSLPVTDASGWQEKQIEEWIKKNRSELSHCVMPLDKAPLFEFRALKLNEKKSYLIFSIDLMIIDAASLQIFKDTLAALCEDEEFVPAVPEHTFRDHVKMLEARKKTDKYASDKAYWLAKKDTFPSAPQLPFATEPDKIEKPVFCRKSLHIPDERWRQIKRSIAKRQLSASAVIAAIYAEVLSLYSGQSECALNVTVFDRMGYGGEMEGVIGDFTSTMLIPFDFSGNVPLSASAAKTRDSFIEALDHSWFSGIAFARELKIARGSGNRPIMPFVFTSTLSDADTSSLRELGTLKYGISQTPQVYLDCQVYQNKNGLDIVWDYPEKLFLPSLMDRMFKAFEDAVSDADRLLDMKESGITVSEDDRKKIYEYNDTVQDISVMPLHELFLRSAERYPERIAVKDNIGGITYSELAAKAEKTALALRTQGITEGDLVAVRSYRRKETIISILGILMAGAAYVPIDADNPEARQLEIIRSSGCKAVLNGDEVFEVPAGEAALPDVDIGGLAYVIHTSGSTGNPKGVMITHQAAANTIMDINSRFGVCEDDNIIGLSSICFDLSVYDIFGALSAGAKLVMVPDLHDLHSIERIVQDEEITVWNSVPAIMQMYIEHISAEKKYSESGRQLICDDALRLVMLSGDWIPLDLPDKISDAFPETELYSLGGATEASIWSIYYPVTKVEKHWSSIPYGMPLANQTIFIMRPDMKLCPIGTFGEICIGGKGVAKGYLNDPEKTERAFFTHPEFGRMYHTGDYGIMSDEGYVIFLGRKDTQIKIRGHRIELGEIEAATRKLEAVRDAVILNKNDGNNTPVIIAFLAAPGITEEAYKEEMKKLVPEYMIPNEVVFIDEIPYTSNNKVDRKKLLSKAVIRTSKVRKAPETPLQKQLFEIWKDILLNDDIGIQDDFFDAGGDSVKLIRIAYNIEEKFRVKVSHKELLLASTIEKQCRLIEKSESSAAAITAEADPEHTYEPFGLTDVQRSYLMGRDDIFELGGTSTHGYYEYEVTLDLDRFEAALNKVIGSQHMLRAIMQRGNKQKFLAEGLQYKLEIKDGRGLSDDEFEELVLKERDNYSHEIFYPYNWPLFRFIAIRKTDEISILIFSIDLLIMDAGSVLIFKDMVMKAYDEPDTVFEPLDFTFRDFVSGCSKILEGERYEQDKEYWKPRAESFPQAPALPLKMETKDVRNPRFRRLGTTLGEEEWALLQKHCREHNVSPSAAICTAYVAALSYFSNQKQCALNVTLFHRYNFHPDVERQIGDFTSTMLLAFEWDKKDLFWDTAACTQRTIMEGLDHSAYSGIEFSRDIKAARKMSSGIPVPVVFTSTLSGGDTASHRDFGKVLYGISQTSQVYLDCQLAECEKKLVITWDYIECLLDSDMMQQMFDYFREVLTAAAVSDGLNGMVTETEKSVCRLYSAYNDTEMDIPAGTLHGMFIRKAEEIPDKTAVKDTEHSLTYGQLDKLSDKAAAKLIRLGVRKGQSVAVIAHRKAETIAYILGILKAGANYVPVDPENPKARQDEIISSSNSVYVIDEGFSAEDEKTEGITFPAPDPNALAYVIYTSGSTGKPKGVMITHKAAANTIQDINNRYEVTEDDTVLGLSSMCFDLSVYDIFGSLAAGAELVIAPGLHDIARIAEIVEEEEVTVWNSVPAVMQMYVEYAEKTHSIEKNIRNNKLSQKTVISEDPIRLVMLSGDWIPLSLPERIMNEIEEVEVISLGGATEASIWSIYYPVTKIDPKWKSIPYGIPLANQKFYVLDHNMEYCPVYVSGELYIGGAGIAEGYQNDAKKTASSFIDHPVLGRLYRTGDYGRMTPEGYIEFLGRKDQQVKIGGHRIELGEIENALRQISGITDAAVVIREDKGKQIFAYAVSDTELDPSEIRTALRSYIPDYMVPAAVALIPAIPLTSNGKVDRKALLKIKTEVKRSSTPPRTDMEKKLTSYWKEIFGISELSIEMRFSELGGDSLKTLRLTSMIEEKTGLKIPYSMMMYVDTLEEMALLMSSLESKETAENNNDRLSYYRSNEKKPVQLILLPPLVGIHAPYLRLLDLMPETSFVLFDYTEGESMEELVNRYAEQIKRFDLSDRLIIGGHSAGGNFAFEIIKRLEKDGIAVKHLLLMDSFYFHKFKDIPANRIKTIFRVLIRENVLEGQEIKGIYSVLDNYIEKLMTTTEGKINADIVYLKSEPPYLDIQNLQFDDKLWSEHTTGGFELVQGYGSHIKMLYQPHINQNGMCIKRIFNLK